MTMDSIPMDEAPDAQVEEATGHSQDNTETQALVVSMSQDSCSDTQNECSKLLENKDAFGKDKCCESEENMTIQMNKSYVLAKKLPEHEQAPSHQSNLQKNDQRTTRSLERVPYHHQQYQFPGRGYMDGQTYSHGNQHAPVYGSPPRGSVSDRRDSYSSGLSWPASKSHISGSSKTSTPLKRLPTAVSSQNMSTVSEGPVCRICHDGDTNEVLISPCYCAGSLGMLHVSCLQTWLGSSNKTACEICNFHFALRRKPMSFKQFLEESGSVTDTKHKCVMVYPSYLYPHKQSLGTVYGKKPFLEDPGSVKDKKHLLCDGLSFLIVTPLTVLTTYMCFAGALKYYEPNSWERGGLVGLAFCLIILYSIWFLTVGRHDWHMWRNWQMFHQEVTLLCTPDQRKFRTSHNADGKSDIGSQHSKPGSVQIQSIKISVHGSLKHYNHGHQATDNRREVTDCSTTSPVNRETAVTRFSSQEEPSRTHPEQYHRNDGRERTVDKPSSTVAGISGCGHPRTFYSPRSKYLENEGKGKVAYAENSAFAYEGKKQYLDRNKVNSAGGTKVTRNNPETGPPVVQMSGRDPVHRNIRGQSVIYGAGKNRNVDKRRSFDPQTSNNPAENRYDVPKPVRNDIQNWKAPLDRKPEEDNPLMSQSAAIFSRGNSPIKDSNLPAPVVAYKPATTPSMEYTQDWINESPSVGEALSSLGGANSSVGGAHSSGSGVTYYTMGPCTCKRHPQTAEKAEDVPMLNL